MTLDVGSCKVFFCTQYSLFTFVVVARLIFPEFCRLQLTQFYQHHFRMLKSVAMKFDVSKFQTNHRRFSLSIPVLCSDGQLTKIFILDDICPLLVLCAELSCGRSATLLAAAGSWLLYCVPLVQLE